MKTLQTARLTMRKATQEDAPFLVRLMNDDGYLELIGDRHVRTEADALNYLRSSPLYAYGEHGLGYNVVELRDGTPIGICGLLKRDAFEDVDLGYAILASHSGQGYATEAATSVLNYAQSDLGLKRLIAITVEENAGSRKVLERIGMRLEQISRPEGSDRNTCTYGLDER